MCNLDQSQREIVTKILNEDFLIPGISFTGWEVSVKVLEKNPTFSRKNEISSFVRELYNQGNFGEGWASMSIIPKKGPLLFFKFPDATPEERNSNPAVPKSSNRYSVRAIRELTELRKIQDIAQKIRDKMKTE